MTEDELNEQFKAMRKESKVIDTFAIHELELEDGQLYLEGTFTPEQLRRIADLVDEYLAQKANE